MCIRDRVRSINLIPFHYDKEVGAAFHLTEVLENFLIFEMCIRDSTEGIIKGNEKGGFVCMDETARKMLPYNKEYELRCV